MQIYKKNYKALLIIPFLLLILSIGQLATQYAQTGEIIQRSLDLKGGVKVVIQQDADFNALADELRAAFPGEEIEVNENARAVLSSQTDANTFSSKVAEILNIPEDEVAVSVLDPSLGSSFFREFMFSVTLAFLFMGLAILITFRSWAPSAAVILAAVSDIIVTAAIFNILDLKLLKGGIVAFLMLIGYSVDTDIILSTRVLKTREGTVLERVYSAMKTGMTMNGTTFAAVFVSYLYTNSTMIKQIMLILMIGLAVDMLNTWIQNAGILRWYMEGREQ